MSRTLFLCNCCGIFNAADPSRLPSINGTWQMRRIYPQITESAALSDGKLRLQLPPLEQGPVGIELKAIQ